jgi:ribosomal protein L1
VKIKKDFKQKLAAVEKQIAVKFEEVRGLKQYRKSIEIAMRLKQKVDGKQKAAPVNPANPEPGTGT